MLNNTQRSSVKGVSAAVVNQLHYDIFQLFSNIKRLWKKFSECLLKSEIPLLPRQQGVHDKWSTGVAILS